jgi:hypothetical protein
MARPGQPDVAMRDSLQEAIDESGLDIQRDRQRLPGSHFLDVDEGAKLLGTVAAMSFHRVVAKLFVRFHRSGPIVGRKFSNYTCVKEHHRG